MTLDLSRAVGRAEVQGMGAAVAPFWAIADDRTVRAAWLLSTALALPADDFESLLRELWPELDSPETAISELADWPFVELSLDGYRLIDEVAQEFRSQFLEMDPGRLYRAHELLVALESEREAADPDENWFVRGRIAFYLAGYDQDLSAATFGEAFQSAPVMDRTACRIWLSGLAVHQEPLLSSKHREIAFFRGFRAYVLNERNDALNAFKEVLSVEAGDAYEALASHLAGVLMRRSYPDQSVELITDSIELSERLELRDNEVMARQSLITVLIAEARNDRSTAPGRLAQADELAALNLRVAQTTEDLFLTLACERMDAIARWLNVSDFGGRAQEVSDELATQLIERLRANWQQSLAMDLTENAALAADDLATIIRDRGDPAAALREVTAFLDAARNRHIPASGLQHLAKAVGSLFRVTNDAEVRRDIGTLLDRLNGLRRPLA
jgi:hypothetical protein